MIFVISLEQRWETRSTKKEDWHHHPVRSVKLPSSEVESWKCKVESWKLAHFCTTSLCCSKGLEVEICLWSKRRKENAPRRQQELFIQYDQSPASNFEVKLFCCNLRSYAGEEEIGEPHEKECEEEGKEGKEELANGAAQDCTIGAKEDNENVERRPQWFYQAMVFVLYQMFSIFL